MGKGADADSIDSRRCDGSDRLQVYPTRCLQFDSWLKAIPDLHTLPQLFDRQIVEKDDVWTRAQRRLQLRNSVDFDLDNGILNPRNGSAARN